MRAFVQERIPDHSGGGRRDETALHALKAQSMTPEDIALETLAVTIWSSEIPYSQYATRWTWDRITPGERTKYREIAKSMVAESKLAPEQAVANYEARIRQANEEYYARQAAEKAARRAKRWAWLPF